ncbi:peptidoglycan bridge formation glycyltransferase FemA/FemB family protein, partial [Candidatus Woesebacteria bacterium]|nr:peptidoglycan bridge formation glycyltransferase FemA/FemB family protein [Candidatus Woesebacteria bacterium]
MRDIRQTPQYAKYLKKISWVVEQKHSNYFIKRFPLVGSVIKVQRPEILRYSDIRLLGKKHRAFQIIIEPKDTTNNQWLMANGFKLSKSPYLPTKTLQLDLTVSMNRFIDTMKKDARRAVTMNQELGIKNDDTNLEEFRKNWKKAVGWKRHIPSLKELQALKKSFQKNSLFLLDNNSSGAIFLIGDGIAYYWQAFTSQKGRKQLAQYKIVWEGILWAKARGAKVFDFEGIYDPRFPNKNWKGFTHFKKSFGGYEVEYPG